MRRILLCATLALLTHAAAAIAAADSAATRSALQTLGVHAKHTFDHPDDAHPPSDIAQWRAQLAQLAADAGADPTLAQKHRAVTRLIDELAFVRAHPTLSAARLPQATPALRDRETVTASRGASCPNALGVSFQLPVEIALAGAGQSGAQAWFRLDPGVAGHVQFRTDSSGADPALAVYRDCSGAPLAQNDDARGLDAYVDVALEDRAPLYVRVSNGGSGGTIELVATDAGAVLSGKVTDAATGLPVQNATIQFFNPDGSYANGYGYTDVNGVWSTTTFAGQYYVYVNRYGYISALHPAAPCGLYFYQTLTQNCDIADAALVTAVSGSTVANVDVALGMGQRVAGNVRGAGGAQLNFAEVLLLDSTAHVLAAAYTDASGQYLIDGVPNGTYYLEALDYYAGPYGLQLYDHVACGGPLGTDCDLTLATPVTIAGDDLIGANFDLPRATSIRGTVHGPTGYGTYVYAVPASGGQYIYGYTDGQGNYTLGPLALGDYYVFVTSYGFLPQLYPGVECTPDCPSDLAAGTKISLVQLGDSPQADFTLRAAPLQTGHIKDATTGLPLGGVMVATYEQWPPTSSIGYWTFTDSNGDYSLAAPALGNFYVLAASNDHIDQIYPAIACEQPNFGSANCDASGAVLMNVTPSTTTLPAKDFSLQASSGFSGSVGVRATPAAAIGTLVQAFDANGTVYGAANVDTNGHYVIGDLAPGTYYATAGQYYGNYLAQLWQNIDCPGGCDVTQGTPIALAANSSVGDIDFSLVRQDAVVGQVVDYRNQPIPGVLIDLFDASSLAYVTSVATDAQGHYLVSAVYGGTYFVATEAPGAYIDQIWSGVSCPLGPAYLRECPFTSATSVNLALGATQPHVVNFSLIAPDPIFKNDFE